MKELYNNPFPTTDIFKTENQYKKWSHVQSELLFSDSEGLNPVVSIIIPTYKSLYVFDAIESALAQTSAPLYEIVIVDNDPDNNDYIPRLKAYYSKRISYYRNTENIGLFPNWNRCIELAHSDYLIFLHSDDLLLPSAVHDLWEMHNKVEKEACILALSDIMLMDNRIISPCINHKPRLGGLLKPKEYYRFDNYTLFHNDHDTGCGALYNRNILLKIGGYQSDLYPSGDALIHIPYYFAAPVYKLLKQTRHTRVGENASMKNAVTYNQCNYWIRKTIIERFLGNRRFLLWLLGLQYDSAEDIVYGVKAKRRLNPLERVIVVLESIIYTLHTRYKIGV